MQEHRLGELEENIVRSLLNLRNTSPAEITVGFLSLWYHRMFQLQDRSKLEDTFGTIIIRIERNFHLF